MTVNHIQLLWIPYSQRARLGKRNIYISPSFSWTNTETGFLPRLPVVSFIASVLESLGSMAIVLSRTTDYFRVYRPAHGQFYWLVTLPRFWSTNQRVRNYSNVGMWKLGSAPKAGIGLIDRIISAEIFLVETSSGRQQTPEPSVVPRAERAWQPTGVFKTLRHKIKATKTLYYLNVNDHLYVLGNGGNALGNVRKRQMKGWKGKTFITETTDTWTIKICQCGTVRPPGIAG